MVIQRQAHRAMGHHRLTDPIRQGGRPRGRAQTDNLGGAGRFSRGVKKAYYELGAEWFWVMDATSPSSPGIERLASGPVG